MAFVPAAAFLKAWRHGPAMSAERDRTDFGKIREAAIISLLDQEAGGDGLFGGLQEAVASSEWGRIDPDRRFWALGHCTGDAVAFDQVKDIVHLGWPDLDDAVQVALRTQILDWVRPTID